MAEHTPFPWKARPTARRTSKTGMVDVRGGEHEGFVVANYIREEDAALIVAAGEVAEITREAEALLNELLNEEGERISYERLERIESLAARLGHLADGGLPNPQDSRQDDGMPF